MSAENGSFMDTLEYKIMPKVYGFGAAIVILGAMFKIMHWPGAGAMLVVGLTTEAIIFIISAFQPVHKPTDWSKVYPQLAEDEEGEYIESSNVASADNVTNKLSDMMSNANINQDTINKLGKGLSNLSDNASKLANLSDASVATTEYAKNVKTASNKMADVNKSYDKTLDAMNSMANAAGDAKGYNEQVKNITKNLGALNSMYEMELNDANSHLKAMNKFYGNLSSAMENLADAGNDTTALKGEVSKLSANLSNLNNVYGNMLTAMKG